MSADIRPYSHLQEIIQGVNEKFEAGDPKEKSVKGASAGLLIWRPGAQGEVELLLGRLCKLENDVEKVHGAFANFGGKVEREDFSNPEIPGVVACAAREVEEETGGFIKRAEVIGRLAEKTTQGIKNASWPKFCAAGFAVLMDISNEEIEAFKKSPSKEMSEIKWIPLKDILSAQDAKDQVYAKALEGIEKAAGKALTDAEKFSHPELASVFKSNPKLPSGDEIAHYVARTIVLAKNSFSH